MNCLCLDKNEIPSFDFLDNPKTGTINEMFTRFPIELLLLPLQPLHEVPENLWSASDHLELLGAGKKFMIEDYQRDHLLEV